MTLEVYPPWKRFWLHQQLVYQYNMSYNALINIPRIRILWATTMQCGGMGNNEAVSAGPSREHHMLCPKNSGILHSHRVWFGVILWQNDRNMHEVLVPHLLWKSYMHAPPPYLSVVCLLGSPCLEQMSLSRFSLLNKGRGSPLPLLRSPSIHSKKEEKEEGKTLFFIKGGVARWA